MGIGIFLKTFLPLSIYIAGLLSALLALGGNTRWALLLVTFLIPLRNIIDRVQEFPGGTQFVDILIASSIIGWIIRSFTQHQKFFEKSSLNLIAVLFMVYVFISFLRGNHYLYGSFFINFDDARLQVWKNLCLLPIFYYIVLNNTLTKKDVWSLVAVMCVAMFVMDYYTINQIRLYATLESREKITATFQFLGPNEVAAFFNEYTIILMSLCFVMKRSWKKILLSILILINLYCIVFTYSRGAYVGIAIGMFILFALKNKKLLIPLIIITILWQVILPKNAVQRIKETKNQYGQLDESSQRRINIWQQAIGLFKAEPVLGIGFGVFRYLGLDLGDTHNIYIKILTEQGLIGFLIFLILLYCFFREGFLLYQKGEEDLDRGLGLGLFICIFVLIFNNLFGDRWSYLEPNSYLWIFAGLVCRLNALSRNLRPIEENGKPKIENNNREFQVKSPKKIRYYDL